MSSFKNDAKKPLNFNEVIDILQQANKKLKQAAENFRRVARIYEENARKWEEINQRLQLLFSKKNKVVMPSPNVQLLNKPGLGNN